VNKDNIYELIIYLFIGEGDVPHQENTISKILLGSFEWNKRPPLNINGRQGFVLSYTGDFALFNNSDSSVIHYDNLDDFSTNSGIGYIYLFRFIIIDGLRDALDPKMKK